MQLSHRICFKISEINFSDAKSVYNMLKCCIFNIKFNVFFFLKCAIHISLLITLIVFFHISIRFSVKPRRIKTPEFLVNFMRSVGFDQHDFFLRLERFWASDLSQEEKFRKIRVTLTWMNNLNEKYVLQLHLGSNNQFEWTLYLERSQKWKI